jgi:NO-binding membrane sensor protein with MHYT domain
VAELHHFTYGAFNPIAAYLVAFLGLFLGLLSTARARAARSRGRRTRWLVIAAFAIGGAAIWLMHVVAVLGFDVPASPVRYNPVLIVASLAFAVLTVGLGLIVVGHGRRRFPKTAAAGVFTGIGVLAMHYTGMAAVHTGGDLHYKPILVAVSVLVAVIAATAALWFTLTVNGPRAIAVAAAVMAAAVTGMHYLGMAAVEVTLYDTAKPVSGIRPMLMVVPITLISAAMILGVALSALQAMTEEEFTDGDGRPARGLHAGRPRSPTGALAAAAQRDPGSRPSPRPPAAASAAVAGRRRTSVPRATAVEGVGAASRS